MHLFHALRLGRIHWISCLFYASDICVCIHMYTCLRAHEAFYLCISQFLEFIFIFLLSCHLVMFSIDLLLSHPLPFSLPIFFAVAKTCYLKYIFHFLSALWWRKQARKKVDEHIQQKSSSPVGIMKSLACKRARLLVRCWKRLWGAVFDSIELVFRARWYKQDCK